MTRRVSMATRSELVEAIVERLDRAAGPTSNGFWTSSSHLRVITASMRSECSAVGDGFATH